MCRRILNDRARAEEVSQETFYRLMTRPQSVSQSLGGWLHRAATRLAVNTSPEPFSNILLSLAEDAVAVGASLLMAFHPAVILAVVAIFLVFAALAARFLLRAVRRLFRRAPSMSRA